MMDDQVKTQNNQLKSGIKSKETSWEAFQRKEEVEGHSFIKKEV